MKPYCWAPIVFIFLFFTSCKNKTTGEVFPSPPEKSKTITIRLADSLGSFALSLPVRYDSSFTWTDQSDCGKPCDKIKYRFQPASLKISKETGWIWLDEPEDSVERFTISHPAYFPFFESSDSSFIFRYHQHQKGNLVQNPATYKTESDTLEKINSRYYSIFIVNWFDSIKQQFSKKLLATTAIHNNIIKISFELLTKEKDMLKDNFLSNSNYYLHTLFYSSKE